MSLIVFNGGKCPVCGGNDLRKWTEFHRANCHIQHMIDNSFFCYDCRSDEVKNMLDNPRNCNTCPGTPTCPCSKAAFEAVRKNILTRKSDMDDQRDDWPHALFRLGGA